MSLRHPVILNKRWIASVKREELLLPDESHHDSQKRHVMSVKRDMSRVLLSK